MLSLGRVRSQYNKASILHLSYTTPLIVKEPPAPCRGDVRRRKIPTTTLYHKEGAGQGIKLWRSLVLVGVGIKSTNEALGKFAATSGQMVMIVIRIII